MKLRGILALAALGALVVVVGACSGSNDVTNSQNLGRLHMTMTAASNVAGASSSGAGPSGLASGSASGSVAADPLHMSDPSTSLKSAKATLSSIFARTTAGQLVEVRMDLTQPIDLLQLSATNPVPLPEGLLEPGDYDQFVVVIQKLEVVMQNDTTITIDPPGGGWTAIVNAVPFTVVAGKETSVTLKFRKWASFSWINDRLDFHPEFDCEVDH